MTSEKVVSWIISYVLILLSACVASWIFKVDLQSNEMFFLVSILWFAFANDGRDKNGK